MIEFIFVAYNMQYYTLF